MQRRGTGGRPVIHRGLRARDAAHEPERAAHAAGAARLRLRRLPDSQARDRPGLPVGIAQISRRFRVAFRVSAGSLPVRASLMRAIRAVRPRPSQVSLRRVVGPHERDVPGGTNVLDRIRSTAQDAIVYDGVGSEADEASCLARETRRPRVAALPAETPRPPRPGTHRLFSA